MQDEKFFELLLEGQFLRLFRISPCRTVDGPHMFRAMSDHLKPRLKSSLTEKELEEAMKQLQLCFPEKRTFAKGATFDFVISANQQMTAFINGEEITKFTHPQVSKAFLDIYLGKSSKTPDMKQNVFHSIQAELKMHNNKD